MKICPYVQQVRALLEYLGFEYDVEHIDSGNRPQWLMEASPDGGEVPVLVLDSGEALFQSDSIVEYLDEIASEPLVKGNPLLKARDKAWSRLAADNYLTQCATQRSSDQKTLNERMEDLTPLFQAVENKMGSGPYFNGPEICMVDLSWLPVIHRSGLIQTHSGYDFLASYPKLRKWRHALLDTGLHHRSVPSDFEEIFTGFYLSEETYLGRLRRSGNVSS